MRQKLIAGNWKMNGSKEQIQIWAKEVLLGLKDKQRAKALLFPPAILIPELADNARDSDLAYGAQTLNENGAGAYTGELSADMLLDFDCEYVIVGHSERRAYYGETDSIVADKFIAALNAGLKPVLCVGETLEEREADKTGEVVSRQLDAVLSQVDAGAMLNSVIAYEPVWAIGTGKTASPEQAQAVHAAIRKQLAEASEGLADQMQILYGGSMKPSNAADLLSQEDIDGGLIGGASLQASDFLAIYQAALA